jgi:NitT/TauT family transport system substrate-binding protein
MHSYLVIALTVLVSVALVACSPTGGTAPAAAPPAQAPAASQPAPAAASQPASQPAPAAPPPRPVSVRWSSIVNASQSYIPALIQEQGIGQKYGVDVQLQPLANVGQQWTSMRAGEADVSSGSSLDLLRQRQQGLPARAIVTWSQFSMPIVALADKPYTRFSDLRGQRVGTPSDTLLDWQIVRAAGLRAEGFDVGKDAQPQNAATGLINGLLEKGDLDAAMQFTDFTMGPLHTGKFKEITSVPKQMAAAGFDPQAFYLTYNLGDDWRQKNPDAAPRLVAAILDAMDLLQKDDSVWPALAKRSGMEDPALLPAFVQMQRQALQVAYGPEKIQSTQAILDALNETVGQAAVAVTRVDPAAFDFESYEAAQKLRGS